MFTRSQNLRRALSVGLSLLMLTLSGVVPIMERADLDSRTVAESEHNPGQCPRGHDHTICTQFGANFSAVARATVYVPAPAIVRAVLTVSASAFAPATFHPAHRSRAPPLA